MKARAVATGATRERIVDAAKAEFMSRWYDEVTLQDVARRAGVSAQTVINHFGGKEGLVEAAAEPVSEEIAERRYSVEPGDVAGAVRVLVADYELTGDAVIRLLALEDRVPALGPSLARGRAEHRAWVERTLGGGERLPALIVATDVYTWKLLRRDQRLPVARTRSCMRLLVEGALSANPRPEESG